jgi:tetratricopeptide (TPR) repeat protein
MAEKDYFYPENVYRFAKHLYKQGDYLRAAGEYERYLFMGGKEMQSDSLIYRIGLSYSRGGEREKAIQYFSHIIDGHNYSFVYSNAVLELSKIFLEQKNYARSIELISSFKSKPPQVKKDFTRLKVINYLLSKKWGVAHSISEKFIHEYGDSLEKIDITLANLVEESNRLSRKNCFVAGALSALVPGSGKLYTRRYQDGIYSFLVTGLAAWQAYSGFKDDGVESVKGWVYGTIGSVLYAGNIYGSVVSVKIFNNKLEGEIVKETRFIYKIYFH